MCASVITISGFTAAIATALTVSRIDGRVRTPEDLMRVTVGAIPSTTSAAWLEERGKRFHGYPDPSAALDGLRRGEVDAIVHDEPILRYLVRSQAPDARILPFSLARQNYAIALPSQSPLRELLNRKLLEETRTERWRDTVRRYLGD